MVFISIKVNDDCLKTKPVAKVEPNKILWYLSFYNPMREAQFLKQNAEKWKQYERDLQTQHNPDVFADRFIELTDDLSYSKTFYPKSNTTKYLNGIASQFHQKIYKNKKEKSSRIFSFWQYELPFLFKQYHRQLLYAFLFFIVFTLIGALSAKYDDNIVRIILSDEYVNMTNANIAKGDPFAVYKSENEFTMFAGIAIHNIQVSFATFVMGIFFSVGTVYLIMQNGIMLGSFMQFFFAKGLGTQAVLAIFIHGTIEISVLVVAGCSGLVLGNSLLFPKTYNRSESLKKGGRDAMKIAFGLMPFFIIAAFFEGFVTRHYKTIPLLVNVLILALSLLLIVWYFIFYPIILNKRIEAFANNNIQSNKNFQLWLKKKSGSGR
jgi:uncharacterized membrane protein SpoIIM required for sporulation